MRARGRVDRASVPIPKFAHPCGTLRCELRNQRDTSKFMIQCGFGFEVPLRTCRDNWRNFKSTTLALSTKSIGQRSASVPSAARLFRCRPAVRSRWPLLRSCSEAGRLNSIMSRQSSMTDASTIDAATRRLAAALDGLEAALERRREADNRDSALAAQVAALGTDRSRLAAELDQQVARAQRLDAAA